MKPLEGILILDFSQFLSGPIASLRLADLGARVIKIEQKGKGDLSRSLYNSELMLNGASSIFHALNRNKESFEADLKDEEDLNKIRSLIKKADVVIQNFRPGVFERLGLGFEKIKELNKEVIYAEVSGYGEIEKWKNKPGQDLLAQSLSGITWLTGNQTDGPIPMGLAVADIFAGSHLTQGILAALLQKSIKGIGCKIQVSLLESIFDLQFEMLTTYYQDGGADTVRTKTNNAHAYLGAPYGIFKTQNGHMAIAMAAIPVLANLLDCPALLVYEEPETWFQKRDEIKAILAGHLMQKQTIDWLAILEPADIWCADVLNWNQLLNKNGFKELNMLQTVEMSDAYTYQTTRCPISINGEQFQSIKAAPHLGENTKAISEEFGL
jgi:CoA:oxalate CoA-transferase